MTKVVLQASQSARPAPPRRERGGNFLELALERTLAALDADASLSDVERAAAKNALMSALGPALRQASRAFPPPAPAEMISFAALQPRDDLPALERQGYFRPPAEMIGLAEDDSAEVRLTGGKATWLRVRPAAGIDRSWTCTAIRTAMLKAGKAVLPIFASAGEVARVRAADGFGVYSPTPSATESAGVAFCFRSGEVWAVDTYVQDALRERPTSPPIMALRPQLTAAFESYVDLLERLGAPKPYRWVVGMDGLLGRCLALPDGERAGFPMVYCERDTVEAAGEYDGAGPAQDAIQPFFDALYQACGIPVS